MSQEIIKKIEEIKTGYKREGFVILGFFGSYARNEEKAFSDLDILYEINDAFLAKYPGWDFYYRIERIQQELNDMLGVRVDLANRNALDDISRYFILPEVVYVS